APMIKDSLRNGMNSRTRSEIVSGNRSYIIEQPLEGNNPGASTIGIRSIHLRRTRIDLRSDRQVDQDVDRRMRAQRQQVASRLRAEGAEQAQTVRAEADRQRQVIIAEAERDAQRLRGEGDAVAAATYAEAANRDPAFYAFQRSLEAYRAAFADGQGVIVLDRDDGFLRFLDSDR